jgi:hypothetical protein
MRLRAIPFTDEVTRFIEKYDQVFVVEMNRDGQMYQILLTEYPQFAGSSNPWRIRMVCPRLRNGSARASLAKYTKGEAESRKKVQLKNCSEGKGSFKVQESGGEVCKEACQEIRCQVEDIREGEEEIGVNEYESTSPHGWRACEYQHRRPYQERLSRQSHHPVPGLRT